MKYILFFMSFILLSCSGHNNELFYKDRVSSQKVYHQPQVYTQTSREYRINPHDRLSIIFYKYPELSTTKKDVAKDDVGIEVSSYGTITLPLIKTIRVSGLTKHQLEKFLYQKYDRYLKDPVVKVEILNKRVYVMGEVKNPGALECVRYKSITPLKAIIQRGGLSEFANPHSIKVLRGDRKNYKLLNIDLTNLTSVRANNIVLQPDDIVYIPHNKAKDFNMPINGISPSLNIINTIFNSVMTYKALTN